MDASLSQAFRMLREPDRLLNTVPGVTFRGSTPYVNAFIEMDPVPAALADHGVEVVSKAGTIYLARLPVASLEAVAALPGVVRMEGDARVESFLDLSVPEIGADRVWNERKYGNLQGEGVILGMVDTGISLSHRDFDEPGGSGASRVEWVWDQGNGAGPAPSETCRDYTQDPAPTVPCGGTECSPVSQDCPIADEAGHGTLVMGVMAGNGQAGCPSNSGLPCIGVARKGRMIVVKTDQELASEVIQGVDYIFQKAESMGMPAVVNLSLGWYTGPRDGSSLLERNLSNLVQGEGRILVASAGNTNLEMAHARIVSNGGRRTLFLDCAPAASDVAKVYGWYDAPASGSIQVRVLYFQEDQPTPWVGYGDPVEILNSSYGRITIEHNEAFGNARGFALTFDSGSNRLRSGQWHIEARNQVGGVLGATVDLWVDRTYKVGSSSSSPCPVPARFIKAHQEQESTISPPCTADNVVCVGSYNTRCVVVGGVNFCTGCSIDYEALRPPIENCVQDLPESAGDLSSFSSLGPRRDGGTRPWLAAPGNAILMPDERGADTYSYGGGTSFASPHVAGTVALMLDADPTLTVARVLEALRFSARTPPGVQVWDKGWGWGKLDAFAAVERVASEVPPPPPPTPQGLGDGDDICFIATAVYGGIDVPQVKRLRQVRDRFLLKTSWGRQWVRSYYRWSPPVAQWLKVHPAASRAVRLSLLPAVGLAEMATRRNPVEGTMLFLVGLSLVTAVCCSVIRRRAR
jgi:subtilisin family serine protease